MALVSPHRLSCWSLLPGHVAARDCTKSISQTNFYSHSSSSHEIVMELPSKPFSSNLFTNRPHPQSPQRRDLHRGTQVARSLETVFLWALWHPGRCHRHHHTIIVIIVIIIARFCHLSAHLGRGRLVVLAQGWV